MHSISAIPRFRLLNRFYVSQKLSRSKQNRSVFPYLLMQNIHDMRVCTSESANCGDVHTPVSREVECRPGGSV
jgi:hypothetical protein